MSAGPTLSHGLQQSMHQKLVMTPELRQAIQILEMPTAELATFLSNEALANPILEVEVDSGASTDAAETAEGDVPDWAELLAGKSDLGLPPEDRRVRRPDADDPRAPEPASLPGRYRGLLSQLAEMPSSGTDDPGLVVRLAAYIIMNLDDDGYLGIALQELARDVPRAGSDPEQTIAPLTEALALVQTLDPPGVGARDLRECLLLQMDRLGLRDPSATLMRRAVESHLQDIAAGRFAAVCAKLKCTMEELRCALALLQELSPKPGLMSGLSADDAVAYVRPDVVVHRVSNGFVCIFDDVAAPRVVVNSAYAALARDQCGELRREQPKAAAEALAYVRVKTAQAVRLARNVEQRRSTIIKVAEALVRRQSDFMRRGVRFQKPLTLRDVADEIGMHESTVCRAVAGKFIQTPQGTFEMKYFFTSGVVDCFGEGTSSKSVKRRIRELVASERPHSPLTDDEIAAALVAEGTIISRRTVAKYRDELGVAASGRRRMSSGG